MGPRSARLCVVALVAALAACGSDDAATVAPTDAPASAGDGATIEIIDFSFRGPDSVAVGTEVEVVNRDSVPHTWTAADRSFDSGSLRTDASFTHTFADAGTYEFACSIHPGMTGSIDVTG